MSWVKCARTRPTVEGVIVLKMHVALCGDMPSYGCCCATHYFFLIAEAMSSTVSVISQTRQKVQTGPVMYM